jgi:HprK-related kinase B
VSTLAGTLAGVETPLALGLSFAAVDVDVLTNDEAICTGLRRYFAPWVRARAGGAPSVVRLIQGVAAPPADVVDVRRPGARRVKEAVHEASDGRLILKRATGVLMGVGRGHSFAIGDLRAHLNQGVNLVNSAYARVVLRRGHLLLHASAVTRDGRAVAMAGVPGAGKSTAALHLVEHGYRFVSNDRLLARPGDGTAVEVLGYPKQPRVNPGTLLNHPRLVSLLDAGDRQALCALPVEALWALERKSDVDLEAIYGPGTFQLAARLHALVLLTWRFDGDAFRARRLSTTEAVDRVELFHKDLGAFDPDVAASAPPAIGLARYRDLLGRVTVIELSGRTDFAALRGVVADLLGSH